MGEYETKLSELETKHAHSILATTSSMNQKIIDLKTLVDELVEKNRDLEAQVGPPTTTCEWQVQRPWCKVKRAVSTCFFFFFLGSFFLRSKVYRVYSGVYIYWKKWIAITCSVGGGAKAKNRLERKSVLSNTRRTPIHPFTSLPSLRPTLLQKPRGPLQLRQLH